MHKLLKVYTLILIVEMRLFFLLPLALAQFQGGLKIAVDNVHDTYPNYFEDGSFIHHAKSLTSGNGCPSGKDLSQLECQTLAQLLTKGQQIIQYEPASSDFDSGCRFSSNKLTWRDPSAAGEMKKSCGSLDCVCATGPECAEPYILESGSSTDIVCPILCEENYFAQNRACTACEGGVRIAGDNPSEGDTECTPTCQTNEHVSGGVCTACPPNSVRPAGDDPTGGDTECTALCLENEYVSGGVCTPCPTGALRPAGDNPSKGDTQCPCPSGKELIGNTCEEINDCSPDPCQNGGVCTDGLNSYTCQCPPGYEGGECQINIDECSPNPCQNGASCIDGINTHTCACLEGYEGQECQINIDECSPNPCQNGGVCTDGINSHTCTCPDGFQGDNCESEDVCRSEVSRQLNGCCSSDCGCPCL
jgi:hypothetical protein